MISIDELKQRFGPSLNVAPYGECLVIQGDKFNPDWEADLGDQGFTCHFGDLDGHVVTFVQLKKLLRKRRKNEGAASPEVEKVASVAVEEQVEKPTSAREILQGRAGGGNMWTKLWTLDEDNLLVELWNKTPRLTVNAIAAEFLIKFPKRTQGSVRNRLTGLQNEGRIQPRWKLKAKRAKATNVTPVIKSDSAIKSPETTKTTDAEKSEKSTKTEDLPAATKYAPFSDVWAFAKDNDADLKQRAEVFYNAAVYVNLPGGIIGSVISCFEELDALRDLYDEQIGDLQKFVAEVNDKLGALRKEFYSHKHADKTGETMLPPEVS